MYYILIKKARKEMIVNNDILKKISRQAVYQQCTLLGVLLQEVLVMK